MPSVSDELESAATVSELSRAIAELAEPDRRVVRMRYFDGLSTAEIAAHTGVSELAVRKRLWRARNKLRAALEPRGGERFLGLLFGAWRAPELTGARAGGQAWHKGLAGMAAGLALCAGATWWWSQSGRDGGELSLAVLADVETGRVELAAHAASVPAADAPASDAEAEPARRRTWLPPTPVLPVGERDSAPSEPQAVLVGGLVLDLDGIARAGLSVVDAAAPEEVLAETDALGGFRLPLAHLPATLEARGEGLAPILRATFERVDDREGLLLVAPALDLAGRVVDESGFALAHARLELVCDESAFARVEHPVRLVSEVLWASESGPDGAFERPALPRAAGLALRIARAGFETLERPTLALGSDELFVLTATPALAELSGTVRRQDGRPAAGASVRLGGASTTSGADGRFRLPLRGVQPDSALEVQGKRAQPVSLPDFGARVAAVRAMGGVEEVEVVLGDEYDAVRGELVGGAAAGWRVVAYAEGDGSTGKNDGKGNEIPAAETHSDAEGAFELELPRGLYTLYALAPDALLVASRSGLDSRLAPWTLELPPRVGLESLSGRVQGDDGVFLARAEVEVRVQVGGPGAERVMTWKELVSDVHGAFAFPYDPSLEGELSASHDEAASAVATQTFPRAGARVGLALVLARPSFVQVAEACVPSASCAVLDADGEPLAARGPLGGGRFGLHEGWSPVVEVPAAARWLELARVGAEPLRVPIEPRAGQVLKVRP
jgi:hypothetical protein